MKRPSPGIGIAVTSMAVALGQPGNSSEIDVLWLSGSPVYNANVVAFAETAATYDPAGDGALPWNLDFWEFAFAPSPAFATYDVLVIGSTYGVDGDYRFGEGGTTGFFGNGVYATGVMANAKAIAAARGRRTFLTGQDPDWHDYNNTRDQLDGPVGFLINAVNWAASGTGLGIVSFSDRYHAGPRANVGWWTSPGSFLADELAQGVFAYQSDVVRLGDGQEHFPVNEGLTSAGLSGWNTSAHVLFQKVEGYEPINFAGPGLEEFAVTIVTSGEESGGTAGPQPVPLPTSAALLLGVLGGCVAAAGAKMRLGPLSGQ
jgi:hypothetical protein